MREYALVLLVTAAVTYLLTPLVRRFAFVTRAIHEPRSRDTHTKPTPLLGGLAMYGGLVAGLLLASRLSFVQDPFRTAGSPSSGSPTPGGGSARSASWPGRWPRPASWSGAARRCPGCRCRTAGCSRSSRT